MKYALVTTTINVPHLLESYAQDIVESGYTDCEIILTGDNKTPAETAVFCSSLQKKTGLTVIYDDVAAQKEYLKAFPELDTFLPWNCIARRNVAILKAYERGAEAIVTIDDDNFLAQKNYLGGHGKLGVAREITAISAATGWLNICKYLKEAQERRFYPRGFPVSQRLKETQNDVETRKTGKVVANGGFWLGDPDVDAVTRLAAPVEVTGYSRNDNFALDFGTWTPFNSQNTAIHRDAIPSYFLCSDVGRFDDIFASYVLKRIADHLGDFVSFGFPLVKQDRNPHDLWVDVDHERLGTQLTEVFCEMLQAIKLSAKDYASCTAELINGLKEQLDGRKMSYPHRAFVNHFIDGYRVWLKTMKRIRA